MLNLFQHNAAQTKSNKMKNKNFFEQVETRQKTLGSHLCLGMDPREEWFTAPEKTGWFENTTQQFNKDALVRWGKQLIDQTEDAICCIKPNLAFYSQVGVEGLEALQKIIRYAKEKEIPVLLDAKYGDIGSTATAYAKTAFDYFDADCVTLNPYLGYDAIKPFLEYENKCVFILAKTSNPSSCDVQDITTPDNRYIYEHIAEKAKEWGNRVGIVVGATMPHEAQKIRKINKESWILAPGIGAQGGQIEKIVSATGSHVIFPMSRGITNDKNAQTPNTVAHLYKNEIEKRFKNIAPYKSPSINPLEQLMISLIDYDIVKFGQFRLKSGAVSPVYIDLRSIISYPNLLESVALKYISLIKKKNLEFDRIVGVAYGALGTAFYLANAFKKPFLLVKKEDDKQYGINNHGFVGHYNKGEKVLLIEDIATTGGSALRAAEKLRAQGLEVTDVVVLLDRQAGAYNNFAEKNIRMHAVATMSEMIDVLHNAEKLTDDMHQTVKGFINES